MKVEIGDQFILRRQNLSGISWGRVGDIFEVVARGSGGDHLIRLTNRDPSGRGHNGLGSTLGSYQAPHSYGHWFVGTSVLKEGFEKIDNDPISLVSRWVDKVRST